MTYKKEIKPNYNTVPKSSDTQSGMIIKLTMLTAYIQIC